MALLSALVTPEDLKAARKDSEDRLGAVTAAQEETARVVAEGALLKEAVAAARAQVMTLGVVQVSSPCEQCVDLSVYLLRPISSVLLLFLDDLGYLCRRMSRRRP